MQVLTTFSIIFDHVDTKGKFDIGQFFLKVFSPDLAFLIKVL